MSKLTDVLSELAYPIREPTVLLAMVVFYALLTLALFAGLLGLFLLLIVIPALCRYLTLVLMYRAQGRDAEPPTAELFQLVGNGWSLYPMLLIILFGMLQYELTNEGYSQFIAPVSLGFAVLFPAMLAVLAITHSPLETLKPHVLYQLVVRCGPMFWAVPAVLVGMYFAYGALASSGIGSAILNFIFLYLFFAAYAMLGGVLRINQLVEDVAIPDPVEPDEDTRVLQTTKMRNDVLGHAYALLSRGNREAGMEHIYQALDIEAEPDDAWRYYQDQMLRWENTYPALLFAQQYLHRLLAFDDALSALKLITRARHANEDFKPLSADIPKALAFAEAAGNRELADYLRALS
ncbi:MAG: hypothetical protein AAF351_08865 [Pseudomonadota bacterium]